jgi:hypothetical protein
MTHTTGDEGANTARTKGYCGSAPCSLERHYTLKQAAERFFGEGPITESTLRNAIRKGLLQATMPEGKLLVTEAWLVEWFDRCRVQGSSPISTARERHQARSSGSSETERIASAQAAVSAVMTRKRSEL